MVEEIAFENGRISNFEGLVTLTLDRVILHTIVHHSSTSTYMPNFMFHGNRRNVLWMDGHLRPTLLGRLFRVDLMKTGRRKLLQVCILKTVCMRGTHSFINNRGTNTVSLAMTNHGNTINNHAQIYCT